MYGLDPGIFKYDEDYLMFHIKILILMLFELFSVLLNIWLFNIYGEIVRLDSCDSETYTDANIMRYYYFSTAAFFSSRFLGELTLNMSSETNKPKRINKNFKNHIEYLKINLRILFYKSVSLHILTKFKKNCFDKLILQLKYLTHKKKAFLFYFKFFS